MQTAAAITWASAIAAAGMPTTLTVLAYAISPRGEANRDYGVFIPLGALTLFSLPAVVQLVDRYVIPHPVALRDAIERGFVTALADVTVQFAPFLLWLCVIRRREARDGLFGAMMGTAAVNFWTFRSVASGPDDWLQFIAMRSFIFVPAEAVGAFVVGVWAGLAVAEGGMWAVARAAGAFAVAYIAGGLWSTGTNIGRSQPDLSWLRTLLAVVPMAASVAVNAAAIAVGVRRLHRVGIYLRRPWRVLRS